MGRLAATGGQYRLCLWQESAIVHGVTMDRRLVTSKTMAHF
jgi:hypothetical protein